MKKNKLKVNSEHSFRKQEELPQDRPEKKDLETALKEKVLPLLEETMEKHWGISIPKVESDITDQLKKPHLNLYVGSHLPFSEAKKQFKAEFITRELRLHRGNISHLAKTLGVNRRSVHRVIKDLEINVEKAREETQGKEDYHKAMVDHTIRSVLEQYKQLILPQKLESIYQDLPLLSRNIVKVLPLSEWQWKEAEQEFEKQFLTQILDDNHWNISRTAEKTKLRAETLHRKIKKLRLKKSG